MTHTLQTVCITYFSDHVCINFRKRGGSVDNLLDDLGDLDDVTPGTIMTKASKKKSVSSKNLSMSSESGGMKLVPPSSSDTEECTRITTV